MEGGYVISIGESKEKLSFLTVYKYLKRYSALKYRFYIFIAFI